MRKHITVLFILYFLLATPVFAQNQDPSLYLPEGAKARFGNGRATQVEYTPDGLYLAVGSTIGVWLYDAKTYEPILLLSRNILPIRHLLFSSEGNILVSATTTGTISLWDMNIDEYIGGKLDPFPYTSIALSPNGRTLVTGSVENIFSFYDLLTGEEIPVVGQKQEDTRHLSDRQDTHIYGLSFSPNGTYLANGNQTADIDVWHTITGMHILTLKGHKASVHSTAFSPDGRALASVSRDGSVRLWDIDSGEQTHIFEREGEIGMAPVVYSPDGSLLVAAGLMGEIFVLDGYTAEHKKTLTEHTQRVNDITFSSDMRSFASSSFDGSVRIWNVASGENIQTISNHIGQFACFAWSKDGKAIIAPDNNWRIYVWDAGMSELKKTYATTDLKKTFKNINMRHNANDIAVSPIDTTFAIASSQKIVSIWDVETGEQQRILKGATDFVLCVAYSPDGKMIAAGSRDKFVYLWDVETGELMRTLEGHTAEVRNIAYSPDGKMIASGSRDAPVLLWDAETGEQNDILGSNSSVISALAFSPDGKTLAISKLSNTIYLYDLETGAEKQIDFVGHFKDYPFTINFSADGKWLAVGSTNGTVGVMDVGSGEVLKLFEGHKTSVNGVAFSPDGKSLVSNCTSGAMYLWDVGGL